MRILIILLLLVLSIFLLSCQPETLPEKLCFEGNCYDLELAITQTEKTNGLMNREVLPQDQGMLFVYDEPVKSIFWMKNTIIPLDILWLDENFQVLHIENAVPCDNLPCELYGNETAKSSFVLEINSGEVDRINISVGDTFVRG
jgi:uncharacterized protein